MALGARGLRRSPHTSLMAICGHYSPPISHTHVPECSFCSCRAAAVGLCNTTAATAAAAVLACFLLLLLMFVLSIYPLKHATLTHQCACSHARRCLSANKMGEIHTHTHAKYGLSNGGSSHAVSPRGVYPFHFGSIPRSYSTSLLFSSFNLFLSPCPSHQYISRRLGPAVD